MLISKKTKLLGMYLIGNERASLIRVGILFEENLPSFFVGDTCILHLL